MERSALLIIASWVLFSSAVSADPPDPSWRLVKEGEDVAVYTRDVTDSKYVESLAQTAFKVRLSALVALIMDGNSHARWVDSVDESRPLEVVSPTETLIYTLSGAPWPVADRDAVVLTRVEQDPKSLVVTMHSVARPKHLPEKEGTVRVPSIDSTWTLVPQSDGVVEVNFRAHNDPGGEIPSFLINSLATDQPYKTLENLRSFFESENEYRDVVLPHVKEPGS